MPYLLSVGLLFLVTACFLLKDYRLELVVATMATVLYVYSMPVVDPVKESIWISIEGNISSGKTTLLNHLKERVSFGLPGYDIRFIDEDILAWGEVFKSFYRDPKRWSFTFQFKVIATRIQQYRDTCKAIHQAGRPALVISERSLESSRFVFTKMCRESGNFEDIETDVYNSCYDIVVGSANIDLYIYCATPPEICKDRYEKRAREGETLDFNYLVHCDRVHTSWLVDRIPEDRVVYLNTSEEVSEHALDKWFLQICMALRPKWGTSTE